MITSSYRVIRGSDHIVNEPPNDFAGGLLSLTAVPTPWHHAVSDPGRDCSLVVRVSHTVSKDAVTKFSTYHR